MSVGGPLENASAMLAVYSNGPPTDIERPRVAQFATLWQIEYTASIAEAFSNGPPTDIGHAAEKSN